MTREKALALRALIEKAAVSLPDVDAVDAIELFPTWMSETSYAADERIRYAEKLYRCVQAHTSQDDWTPDVTPALWAEVAKPGEIPVWVQPTGAQNAYRIGDKVHYPGKEDPVYVCVTDYNVFPPDVSGWELEV